MSRILEQTSRLAHGMAEIEPGLRLHYVAHWIAEESPEALADGLVRFLG